MRAWLVVSLLAGVIASGAGAAGSQPAPAGAKQPPVVVKVDGGGFHWQDAGLGAAAALAVVLLVHGLALTARAQRRG